MIFIKIKIFVKQKREDKIMINKEKTKMVTNVYTNKYFELRSLKEKWKQNKRIKKDDLKSDSTLNIYVEPTNACNLNCYFCGRDQMNRDITYLSMKKFKKIIDPLPSGTYITMTGNGEPLLNKNIYEMIEYASDQGMLVSIITNGTALTDENTKKLINSGILRVQISCDTVHEEIYEKMRKGAEFKDTLLKILNFIYKTRKKEMDIFITISAVQTDEVKKYAKETKEFWESMPIDNYFESELLSLQTDSNSYEESIKEDQDWSICTNPWISTKVNSNGTINPCALDISNKYVIGNISEDNILEIINSRGNLKLKRALCENNKDFFKKIGYNCHLCNTWQEGVGYGIEEFLEHTLPIRLGLVTEEVNTSGKGYSLIDIERAIKKLETKGKLL